jgi:hypothetical protein
MSLENSTALMAVKTCSKAILAPSTRRGKNPCFSEVAFLRLFGVDSRALKVKCLHGAKTLECARKQVKTRSKTRQFQPKKRQKEAQPSRQGWKAQVPACQGKETRPRRSRNKAASDLRWLEGFFAF